MRPDSDRRALCVFSSTSFLGNLKILNYTTYLYTWGSSV